MKDKTLCLGDRGSRVQISPLRPFFPKFSRPKGDSPRVLHSQRGNVITSLADRSNKSPTAAMPVKPTRFGSNRILCVEDRQLGLGTRISIMHRFFLAGALLLSFAASAPAPPGWPRCLLARPGAAA